MRLIQIVLASIGLFILVVVSLMVLHKCLSVAGERFQEIGQSIGKGATRGRR